MHPNLEHVKFAVAAPGFGQGGGSSGPPDLADVAEWSRASEASILGMGSGALRQAPEAFGVFMAEYVFS